MEVHLQKPERGFSLIELMVVAAIIGAMTVLALPRVMSGIQDLRLRGAAQDVAGLVQRARIESLKYGRVNRLNYTTSGTRSIYIDYNADGLVTQTAAGGMPIEPRVVLPNGIDVDTSTTFSGWSTVGGFTTAQNFNMLAFTARGIACLSSHNPGAGSGWPGVTTGNNGFVLYLRQTRAFGAPGLVAVVVNLSGRAKTYTWNGTTFVQ